MEVYIDSDYAQQTSERKWKLFFFFFLLSSSCFTRQRPDEGKLILQLQPNQKKQQKKKQKKKKKKKKKKDEGETEGRVGGGFPVKLTCPTWKKTLHLTH